MLRKWINAFSLPLIIIAISGCNAQIGDAKSKNPKAACTAGKAYPDSDAGLKQVQLCIQSGKKLRAYTVEVASNSKEQAQGLMFRKSLADNAGMIFPFPEPKMASFWMKNTVIPLDIIFIRADGSIESIAANTTPYSLNSVGSGEEVKAVLELRGGLTQELGIKPGDKVRW
jgi:uncharacterized protein